MVLKSLVCGLLIAWFCGALISSNKDSLLFVESAKLENINLIKMETDDPYVDKNVLFYLYTRENPTPYQLKINDSGLLQHSTFNSSLPTKVLIHGFMNSYLNEMEQTILDAYLYNQDVNILAVSWEKLAGSLLRYDHAAKYTQPVGGRVAKMIDFLVSAGGADIADFHLIGHSLGAHVAGFASNNVLTGRITRISGLDPALPLFDNVATDMRLDPSDADLVDCIHVCGGLYGFYDPICTIDFYPNGGTPIQPGCFWFHLVGVCSHGAAYHYYAASVNETFEAQYCESFAEVERRKCTGNLTGVMGDPAPSTAPGLYYLQTTGSYPYLKNWTTT